VKVAVVAVAREGTGVPMTGVAVMKNVRASGGVAATACARLFLPTRVLAATGGRMTEAAMDRVGIAALRTRS
jgi:hypothetical protein